MTVPATIDHQLLQSITIVGKGHCTWHAHVEVGELDLRTGSPLERVYIRHVGKSTPEVLLRPQTHQTDQEGIFIPTNQPTNTHVQSVI